MIKRNSVDRSKDTTLASILVTLYCFGVFMAVVLAVINDYYYYYKTPSGILYSNLKSSLDKGY